MTHDHDTTFAPHAAKRLPMSVQDLENLGLNDLAYVKPIVVEGQTVYAVHAADGSAIGVLPGRDVAFAAVVQHGLQAVSVH